MGKNCSWCGKSLVHDRAKCPVRMTRVPSAKRKDALDMFVTLLKLCMKVVYHLTKSTKPFYEQLVKAAGTQCTILFTALIVNI